MAMVPQTFGDQSAFLHIFPPPKFLSPPSVGLDISDESVKFIELVRHKGSMYHGRFDSRNIPVGVLEGSAIKDPDTLSGILKKLRVDYSLRFVRMSLPEEHAYFFQTEVPQDLRKGEVRELIASELEENVPILPQEAVFDAEFYTGTRRKGFLSANVVVYPRRVVQQYLAVVDNAGLVPLSLEIESQAFARAVVPMDEKGATMVVDVGRSKAGIAILSGGTLLYTATLGIGGDEFTKAVMRGMNIPLGDAETLKKTRAFIKVGGNEAFFDSLLTKISALRDEVTKHYQYWLEHGTGGDEEKKISKIFLTGGNANIIGIAEYLSATMRVPVIRGNVWVNVCRFDDRVPQIDKRTSFRYGTAIGLALRNFFN